MSYYLNLSDIQGYARLYVSLLTKSEISQSKLGAVMYDWYKGNIEEYNGDGGEQLAAVSKAEFWERISHSHAEPYKTNIQLIKAIQLVMWNSSLADEYTEAVDTINALNTIHTRDFEQRTGYLYSDSATAFASCEDSLNPTKEPESDFDFMGLVRRNNDGPKFVYICAPLRGDVESNIKFAAKRAREVFEAGDIPVCPHLLFPPIADVGNALEDEKAMQMCFKLIARCDEMRVCGTEISEGMKHEIEHAGKQRQSICYDCYKQERSSVKENKTKHTPCR